MDVNSILSNLAIQIGILLVACGSVERLCQIIKSTIIVLIKKELSVLQKDLLVVTISILFCLLTGVKFEIGIQLPLFINEIISGLLISFGSASLHTVLSFIQSVKSVNESTANISTSSDLDIKG